MKHDFYWTILKKTGILFLMLKKKKDVNYSLDNFLLNMNGLLCKHAPFKKVSKYQLKLKTKPWITAAIHKTILVESSLRYTLN